MFDKLKSLDVDLLIFLNNLGSDQFDFLWLIITNKYTWIPLYIFLIYLHLNSIRLKIRSIFLNVFFILYAKDLQILSAKFGWLKSFAHCIYLEECNPDDKTK